MKASILINEINKNKDDNILLDIYEDNQLLDYQKNRYIDAINCYIDEFGDVDICVYSAPGRTEMGGNHTDHQHGQILAASINLDAIGVVSKNKNRIVSVKSQGYDRFDISLDDLKAKENEKGTSIALVKGVLAGFEKKGIMIDGFNVYITSDVLIGSGLSSSAAYETLIGYIISGLFNDSNVSAEQIAMVGQYAENIYFGKPCGLMDQMASSVGSVVYVDFAKPSEPKVEKVSFDLSKYGYELCITDTMGSHADLTSDYAAIPKEMKDVAMFFGKDVLLGISVEDILNNIDDLRNKTNDRSILRAIHFINENERVVKQVDALKCENIDEFLKLVEESGNSSYKYLQNVYSNNDYLHQNVSLALAISEDYLKEGGVCRVHGGGFAGTIQAFVKKECVDDYKKRMDMVFKDGACKVLKIRKYGGIKVF